MPEELNKHPNGFVIPQLTKNDRRVFAVLFNKEAAGISARKFKERTKDMNFLPKFMELNTVGNIIVDLTKTPNRYITDEDRVQDFYDLEAKVIILAEKDAFNKPHDIEAMKLDEHDIDAYGYHFLPDISVINECQNIVDNEIFGSYEDAKVFGGFYVLDAVVKRLSLQYKIAMIKKQSTNQTNYEELLQKHSIREKEVEIFDLLHKAVDLSLPEPVFKEKDSPDAFPEYTVSRKEASVLQSAYSQFASMLIIKAARLETSMKNETSEKNKEELRAIMNFFEAEASHYMYISGAFGDEIAKELSTKINPYAKLCGNVVMQTMVSQFYGPNF
ncbi:hypothetical protein DASC09_019950 [Saccharomycopsis crataegensis]|uniref:Uncharacterized protein n=1 Tax=Saccharomycopsis crataegensis TaxID=43959 RepID=A0AAV5QJW6_9ASCO|nr:hypothetical protein DASC09_019950 [Saccharomycopsis crataegensis]